MQRRRKIRTTLVLLACLAAPAAAQTPSTADARKEVERTNQEFLAALKAGDPTKTAALLAENGVIVQDDGTKLEGRAAAAAAFKEMLGAMKVAAASITIDSFGASGSTAWAAGKETGMFVDKKTNSSIPLSVLFLAVYERQANGRYFVRYWLETDTPKPPK